MSEIWYPKRTWQEADMKDLTLLLEVVENKLLRYSYYELDDSVKKYVEKIVRHTGGNPPASNYPNQLTDKRAYSIGGRGQLPWKRVYYD